MAARLCSVFIRCVLEHNITFVPLLIASSKGHSINNYQNPNEKAFTFPRFACLFFQPIRAEHGGGLRF
jgi:hypothetical protein